MNILELHKEICEKGRTLMESKNHDYTSGSGDVFANFRGATYLGIHPILGIQLRQQDKMQRIKTFVERGRLKVANESVEDAIVDQINYLVLQYGMIKEMQQQGSDAERQFPLFEMRD